MKEITKQGIIKELINDSVKSTLLVKVCIVVLLLTVGLLVVTKGSIGICVMLLAVAILFTVLDIKANTERRKKIHRIENGDFTIKSVNCVGKMQEYYDSNSKEYDVYMLDFGEEHGGIEVDKEVYDNTEEGDLFYIVYFDEDATDIHLAYNQKEYKYCE